MISWLQVWKYNTAEAIGTADTDPAVFDEVVAFAGEIGLVPIPIHKEKAGYVLNSLLVPFLNAAAALASGGFAEPKDVDNVRRIATGSPLGPFQFYDIIGLTTPYNILVDGDADAKKIAEWLKANYIDRGKLGVASGEGFYSYNWRLGGGRPGTLRRAARSRLRLALVSGCYPLRLPLWRSVIWQNTPRIRVSPGLAWACSAK